MAGQAARSVRICSISFSDDVGQHTFDAKAWVYNSGVVMWEARRFIIAFYKRKRKIVKVCEVMRENATNFEQACGAMGMQYSEAMKDSLRKKSASDVPEEDVDDPLVRQEYSWSTRLTIAAAIVWGTLSKTRRDKAAGHSLLVGFLRAICGSHAVRVAAVRGHMRSTAVACIPHQAGDAMCPHQEAIVARIADSAHDDWDFCGHVLMQLFLARSSCAACAACLSRITWFLEVTINQYLEFCEATRPMKISQLEGHTGRKRRRFDEDYKEALTTGVQEGKVLSSNAVGKNTEDFGTSSCNDWRLQALSERLCAAWKQYGNSEVLSVCQDGVKAGNPLEETDCYLIWDATADNGFVLVPQVMPKVVRVGLYPRGRSPSRLIEGIGLSRFFRLLRYGFARSREARASDGGPCIPSPLRLRNAYRISELIGIFGIQFSVNFRNSIFGN